MNKQILYLLPLILLFFAASCRDNKDEQQMLDRIEQTWQKAETSLSETQMQAEGLRDSVRKSSELAQQRYNLLTIRLRDKPGVWSNKTPPYNSITTRMVLTIVCFSIL